MDSLTFGSQRLVHLDLKGAPLKISFYEKFFPFIKDIGATGILIEWEDTFPYTRELIQIGGLSNSAQASGAPYSIEEAKQLLCLAEDCGLSVIPLVQTFGHMEFVLKHEQWRSLREVEAYPSSMCPSNSGTMPLVRSLIKQIVAFHNNIQYIHIGADEVWHMGMCAACIRRTQSSNYGKATLYLDHVTEVAQFIKESYPNLKIIIWDDMLRNIDLNVLQEYYLGNLVEPMIWHYNNIDTFQLGPNLWDKYSNIFTNVWGASAFKGATSSCQILPINKYHVSNHESWLAELSTHASKIVNFRGIALTGWSRYDHYATLCELLPTSIPTLCLCMKTWLSGGYNIELHSSRSLHYHIGWYMPELSVYASHLYQLSRHMTTPQFMNPAMSLVLLHYLLTVQAYSSVGKMLGYTDTDSILYMESPVRPVPLAPQLTFPGWHVLLGLEWFTNIKAKYKSIIDSDQVHTWFNQWQVVNNYTNPMQIESILPVLTNLHLEISSLENYVKSNFEQYFYPNTIDELLGTLIMPIKQHLRQLKCECETQLTNGCRVRGQKQLNI